MRDPRRNSPSIPEPWLSDAWIDRLVDGELSGSDYRAVLAALERHPEHWRRCAQAFLEAQAWRREMADWVSSPDQGTSGGTPFDAILRAVESSAGGTDRASRPGAFGGDFLDDRAADDRVSDDRAAVDRAAEDQPGDASLLVAASDSDFPGAVGTETNLTISVNSSSEGPRGAGLESVESALPEAQHSALARGIDLAIDEADETGDESDESVQNWDHETPRLQAAVLPRRSSQDSSSRWQPLPRTWLDWASPLASVAVICGVFWLGWRLSEQASNEITTWESGADRTAARSNTQSASPLGHVRLAVDGGGQSVAIPYFAPEAYPQGNTVRNSPSVEQVIATRGVDRQRMVMPGRLDERRDVLLPLEVISLPAQTDFQ